MSLLWSMHALSSQHLGSAPPWVASKSFLNLSIARHLSGASSRQLCERKPSTSPTRAVSVLAKSPLS